MEDTFNLKEKSYLTDYIEKRDSVAMHFDKLAANYDEWKKKNFYYYENLKDFTRKVVYPGSRVLEVGCATGEILAASKPSYGVGIDISLEMVKIAEKKYPGYHFFNCAIEEFQSNEKFDFILLIDLLHHVYDVVTVFESIKKFCHPGTKIIVTIINPWWEPVLKLMAKMHAKMPEVPLNYLERRNIKTILEAIELSVIQTGCLLLFPKKIPLLSFFANSLGVRLWGLNKLSFVQYMIIQNPLRSNVDLNFGCSVIIPCYNEEGNIAEAVRRIPNMGKGTEIIVVNDGSKDKTADIVKEMQKNMPNLKLIDYSPNEGKGRAVKKGFDAASEEVIMILDADMTVPPEELHRFFEPLNKGICQFTNGTRLVYPRENQSMKVLNMFGNKIFSLIMTFITRQTLTDTLCGTKALLKKDYKHIKMGLDKWGDFDLLFGAARSNNRILEVPVHYKSRRSGESKMNALKHGMHLLKACFRGFKELVFLPLNDTRDK